MKTTNKAMWIWFPHDFEIYHCMKQNAEREERGVRWPAYWKMDSWHHNVRFFKTVRVQETEVITLYCRGTGYVSINGRKLPLSAPIRLKKGEEVRIEIVLCSLSELPCVIIPGHSVWTDGTWMADNYEETLPAGTSPLYTGAHQDPNVFRCPVVRIPPQSVTGKNKGILFDFGRECFGSVELFSFRPGWFTWGVTLQYGESEEEALDGKRCYCKQENVKSFSDVPARAFRYIFIPGVSPGDFTCNALHEVFPITQRASFACGDTQLDQIWEVAAETFRLCSRLFFLDGIKRDRWVWSGDAYQSYFVNRYLFFDTEIDRRTIRALRGQKEMQQHINTIVDYTMLWLISLENEYWTNGDLSFVKEMYPKAQAAMEFLLKQTQEQGFIYGRERDWIYIDWCEMDKTGCVCAEQILLWKALRTMGFLTELMEKEAGRYREKAAALREKILEYYWDDEKGAFIDSYESGKRNVTRHANIFALLYDFADEAMAKSILDNVLLSDQVPVITTPYFRFYELDVLAKYGYLKEVMETIRSYWGGMLERGAVTFWELFDPNENETEQYGMYGDPYGKSLCHAWAASPVYLIGRWFLGVEPLEPGYRSFSVSPKTEFFEELDCIVPVKDGSVRIIYRDGELAVRADRKGGILVSGDVRKEIPVPGADSN